MATEVQLSDLPADALVPVLARLAPRDIGRAAAACTALRRAAACAELWQGLFHNEWPLETLRAIWGATRRGKEGDPFADGGCTLPALASWSAEGLSAPRPDPSAEPTEGLNAVAGGVGMGGGAGADAAGRGCEAGFGWREAFRALSRWPFPTKTVRYVRAPTTPRSLPWIYPPSQQPLP